MNVNLFRTLAIAKSYIVLILNHVLFFKYLFKYDFPALFFRLNCVEVKKYSSFIHLCSESTIICILNIFSEKYRYIMSIEIYTYLHIDMRSLYGVH